MGTMGVLPILVSWCLHVFELKLSLLTYAIYYSNGVSLLNSFDLICASVTHSNKTGTFLNLL